MTIKKRIYYLITVLLSALLFAFALTGCEEDQINESQIKEIPYENTQSESTQNENTQSIEETSQRQVTHLEKDGSYTTKEDVMNYLIEYHTLPSNFITIQPPYNNSEREKRICVLQ